MPDMTIEEVALTVGAMGQAMTDLLREVNFKLSFLDSGEGMPPMPDPTVEISSPGSNATLTLNPVENGPRLFALNLSTTTCAIAFAQETVPTGEMWSFSILLTQGAFSGSTLVTFPANIIWLEGEPPTLGTEVGDKDLITLTNDPTFGFPKWIGTASRLGAGSEASHITTPISNTVSFDLKGGKGPKMFGVTLTAATTAITFLNETMAAGKHHDFSVLLKQGTGANRISTYPSNVYWEFNRPPVLSFEANKADLIKFTRDPFSSTPRWLGSLEGGWFSV